MNKTIIYGEQFGLLGLFDKAFLTQFVDAIRGSHSPMHIVDEIEEYAQNARILPSLSMIFGSGLDKSPIAIAQDKAMYSGFSHVLKGFTNMAYDYDTLTNFLAKSLGVPSSIIAKALSKETFDKTINAAKSFSTDALMKVLGKTGLNPNSILNRDTLVNMLLFYNMLITAQQTINSIYSTAEWTTNLLFKAAAQTPANPENFNPVTATSEASSMVNNAIHRGDINHPQYTHDDDVYLTQGEIDTLSNMAKNIAATTLFEGYLEYSEHPFDDHTENYDDAIFTGSLKSFIKKNAGKAKALLAKAAGDGFLGKAISIVAPRVSQFLKTANTTIDKVLEKGKSIRDKFNDMKNLVSDNPTNLDPSSYDNIIPDQGNPVIIGRDVYAPVTKRNAIMAMFERNKNAADVLERLHGDMEEEISHPKMKNNFFSKRE